MVASTHWLASAAGMSVLERGGNAFDAAVATGLTLQVVEPHLNGPGGEVPALLFPVDRGEPIALCGQGCAPAAATIERYHDLGHELVPGTGVLAACVPGAFGGWLLLLEQFGTWRLADVLEFAIGYAEHGFPLVAGIRATIEPHRGAAARLARLARPLPACTGGRRALPQPGARGDLSPDRRGVARRLARAGDRERSPRVLRGLRRRGDRQVLRRRGRAPHRRGHGALARDARAGRQARVRRADRLQDAAVGGRAGGAAAARAPRRLRSRRALAGRVRPRRHGVRQARVRRPGCALRRRRGAAGDAAVEGLQRRAARARRRGRVRGVPAGHRPPASARRGRGDAGGGGADTRRHRSPRRRRPPREHVLGDAERRLAAELTRDPRARLAARHPRADVLARGGARVLAPAGRAPADDALPGARPPGRQALSRLGNSRRRPAGAVGAARLRAPRRSRPEPAGGDRRARVPHGPPDLVLLSPRLRTPLGHASRSASATTSSTTCARAATTSRSPARGRSAG